MARDPLRDFHVWWDDISEAGLSRFVEVLDDATDERPLQQHLEEHPILLIQHLGGGHGRYVLPQKRLGAEYVPDFMIADRDSFGFHWHAVEIESPRATMFNKNGDPSAGLTHAIRQVQDWRAWLGRNQDYAGRLFEKKGLNLTDITANVAGLILIGRRDEVDPGTNELRRRMVEETRIEIHSWDWLVERAEGRMQAVARGKGAAKADDGSAA